MSQGYLGIVTLSAIPGGNVQFKNAMIRIGGDELDVSTSLNGDGSFNEGFSDADGDLRVLSVEIDTILKDVRAMYLLTLYEPMTRYIGTEFTCQFNGEGYHGTGIFVQDKSLSFNIPGEARLRMTFRSLQTGFELTTFA